MGFVNKLKSYNCKHITTLCSFVKLKFSFMEIKNRIKKVMDESGLSASKFADKIGVPRSGLSHVLSGRNKPSLDYVLKMLDAFPELDPNWLLKGQKSMEQNELKKEIAEENLSPNSSSQINDSLARVNLKMEGQVGKMLDSMTKVPQEASNMAKTAKFISKAVRIVYFYKDGSFEEYFPKKD